MFFCTTRGVHKLFLHLRRRAQTFFAHAQNFFAHAQLFFARAQNFCARLRWCKNNLCTPPGVQKQFLHTDRFAKSGSSMRFLPIGFLLGGGRLAQFLGFKMLFPVCLTGGFIVFIKEPKGWAINVNWCHMVPKALRKKRPDRTTHGWKSGPINV